MAAQQSLIAEIETAISAGTADHRVETLRRVTDLFTVGAGSYSEAQVGVFDDVIGRLAAHIETHARAELAGRLAPLANAPSNVVRSLARDNSIDVAGPVLTHSNRLTDEDLLACANGDNQERLLAISRRNTISEAVSDVLVTRGDQEVVRSVAGNHGARFSNSGYSKLVERSASDDELAVRVGLRKDIPKEQFDALMAKASEAAFERIAASNPVAAAAVQRVIAGITGHAPRSVRKGPQRDYTQAKATIDGLQRSGKSIEAAVQVFASTGKIDETLVAIAALCLLPVEAIDGIFFDKQSDNDLVLLLIKAAGLSWPTAKLILDLRRGESGISSQAAETARHHFERLQTSTARRVVRFYQVRRTSGEATR